MMNKSISMAAIVSLLVFCFSTLPTLLEAQGKKTPVPPPPPPTPLPASTMSSLPMDPDVRIGTLSNGMRYYITANARPENRAELRLAVKSGSMQEDEDQLGLAHFVEHMAFNGTKHFSKNELVNYLESVGTRFGPDLNAYTSFDETVYMLQVRTDEPEQFNKGMLILRDWADGIAFDEEEIDKERGVVISEWRNRLSPQQRMQNEYFPVMYYQSRYAERLPIGDPDIIQTASYDVIRRYYVEWYRPELMALFVVGQIDPDEIERQIREQFSSVGTTSMARNKESNIVPDHKETLVRVITDHEATNATVQIMYKHKYSPVKSVLEYRQRLVESLYNRMLGRRLSDIGKGSDPPFIFGYTMYGQNVGDLATYTSYASCAAKDAKSALETLVIENQRVRVHGFTEGELEREKANIMQQAEQSALEEDKMESSRVVQRLINHFLDDSPIPNARQHLDMYSSMMPTITADEVSRLASRWITDQNRVIIITGPEKELSLLPDSTTIIEVLTSVTSRDIEPYEDVDVSAPLLSGAFPAQAPVDMSYDSALQIFHWTFANGVKVSARPTDFKNDEILMNAYSKGGHSLYDDALYPSARSASSIVGSSGVGDFNATSLEKKLTGLRVNVSPFISEMYEGFSGSSSVRDAETMMQLVYSYATAFRSDTSTLGSYVKKEKSRYANLLSNPQNWYYDQVGKITSRNHPRRGFPDAESFDDVRMEEIMEVYSDRFTDVSDMHFFFVGSFDPDTLQHLTGRYLAALPGGGRQESWRDVGDRYPKGLIDTVFHRGEAPKAYVQLLFHGRDTYHPDSAYVLQSLIELARIKLREELREEKGGVYGVSVYGGQSRYPIEQYTINVGFNADPPSTEILLESTRAVIEQLKTTIDPADVLKVTETQRQGRTKDLQENRFWLNAFTSSWINGLDMYVLTQPSILEERISRLTPEVLRRAASTYFNDQEMIRVVMYPEKS